MPAKRQVQILAIGECMVELSRQPDGCYSMAVGGDTFNTAIYLARLGADVGYVTAVGDDPYSARIVETAGREGVDVAHIHRTPARMPGLYLIETLGGERTFWYWRDRSPAREVFELDGAEARLRAIADADAVYLSAITLSLYNDVGLDRLHRALMAARTKGGLVVMDGNYRPVGWRHDRERAREVVARFWRVADIALPTFDDEVMLWGDADPASAVERLAGLGVREVALKCGADGVYIRVDGTASYVPVPERRSPVDTTAAGDSFSAAYLWARLQGRPTEEAAHLGHRLEGIVIGHRGAIAPREAMADLSG